MPPRTTWAWFLVALLVNYFLVMLSAKQEARRGNQ
jgi:hypothetical protein